MISYTSIDTDAELGDFRKELARKAIRTIAIDFESENSLHEYGSRICLIQVFDGRSFFVIDPFGISREELKLTLEDRTTMKLAYGAESDMSLAYKQYGIKMKSLFDLKLMVDVLGFEKRGLGEVTRQLLGIEGEDKKKYQMHNWTRRPIDRQAIEYALSDVAHLFALKQALLDRVAREGAMEHFVERLVRREFDYDKTPVPTLFKSRDYLELRMEEKTRARRMFEIRDRHAQVQNCPPNDLLANRDLLQIAKDARRMELVVPGRRIDRGIFERMKSEIMSALAGETG